MTLHDMFARGNLRQVVFCYVSREKRKLIENFYLLRERFSRIARICKMGNTLLHLHDMKNFLRNSFVDASVWEVCGMVLLSMGGCVLCSGVFFLFLGQT